jgi:hypothetical protein
MKRGKQIRVISLLSALEYFPPLTNKLKREFAKRLKLSIKDFDKLLNTDSHGKSNR